MCIFARDYDLPHIASCGELLVCKYSMQDDSGVSLRMVAGTVGFLPQFTL